MSKASEIAKAAQQLAANVEAWSDLSNALFAPDTGIIAKAYPTRPEREAFMGTKEYQLIKQLLQEARDRTGLVEGGTPQKSGKFVVRLPKTLHSALDAEAEAEGVSLNQLVLAKLAIQLNKLTQGAKPDMASIAQAYLEVRNGFSTDRVVADPELDKKFLHRCRQLGLGGTDFDLNWKLFNARKGSYLSDLPKTVSETEANKDEVEFSCEMAIKHVQKLEEQRSGDKLSLDMIICNPLLAAEFDEFASRLAPGFTPLDYRWVAFGVRKAAGRLAKQAAKTKAPTFDDLQTTTNIRSSKIPDQPGMYLFQCEDERLFVGETENLRSRIERHFDASGKKGIPDWLYESGKRPIRLGIIPTGNDSATTRKVSELSAVLKYHPLLNYLGHAV